MKLVSLNTWGGRAGKEKLLAFFEKHKDVDIFCLQEIWNGGEHMLKETAAGIKMDQAIPQLLKNIKETLQEHVSYFRPHVHDFYGLTIFVRKNLKVIEEGETFVYQEPGYISLEDNGNHARNLQYITLDTSAGARTILNFHGLWKKATGKTDTEDRLLQSDNIVRFLQGVANPHVLCGDFNLLPDTQSLKKLEEFGLRNLIKEYGITSTRTSYYTKEHKFADYALVSKGIDVTDFKILPDEVSDHSAMYLEFE